MIWFNIANVETLQDVRKADVPQFMRFIGDMKKY